MIKTKVLTVPIYPARFTLVLWDVDTELQNKFKTFEFIPSINEFDGGVFMVDNEYYIALRVYKYKKESYPTPGIIAHECKHAVNRIFGDIGQKLDVFNDEAECYLLGWLVNRVHEFTDKHKTDFKI